MLYLGYSASFPLGMHSCVVNYVMCALHVYVQIQLPILLS